MSLVTSCMKHTDNQEMSIVSQEAIQNSQVDLVGFCGIDSKSCCSGS